MALVIVAVVLGAVFAYTQVWPPMVVVESASMMHGGDSLFGVVDTGDLVLVQRASRRGDVVTYVEGRATGYATYGDFGDVLIFNVPGQGGSPIIHRPILYVEWNGTANGYDVPSLTGLDRSAWEAAYGNLAPAEEPVGLNGVLRIFNAGYRRDLTLEIDLGEFAARARYDGYITMGDGNAYAYGGGRARPDSWLIPHDPSTIVGKARGELPWFGLLKLTLFPTDNCCPMGWGDPRAPGNSWDALAVSLVLIVAAPFAVDFGWAYWTKRRERAKPPEETEASVEDGAPLDEEPPPPRDEEE